MSYVLRPPVDTAGFVENPLTAELDANSNDISNAGTISASVGDMTNVSATTVAADTGNLTNANVVSQLSHTDPTGVIGLYGVPPTPQNPPIADAVGANPHANEIAINEILNALRALGVVAV